MPVPSGSGRSKPLSITDCAMNIAPNLTEKIQILNNSVKVLNNLGIEKPKVAVLGAVEKVNTDDLTFHRTGSNDISSFFLQNWTQDYCATLYNAALTDAATAKVGVSFCQGILLQFSDEDSHFLNNFKASLGEFHYLAAEAQEGEKILTDLINDYPQCAIGYAYLADMLGAAKYNPAGDAPVDLDR